MHESNIARWENENDRALNRSDALQDFAERIVQELRDSAWSEAHGEAEYDLIMESVRAELNCE